MLNHEMSFSSLMDFSVKQQKCASLFMYMSYDFHFHKSLIPSVTYLILTLEWE